MRQKDKWRENYKVKDLDEETESVCVCVCVGGDAEKGGEKRRKDHRNLEEVNERDDVDKNQKFDDKKKPNGG